MPRRIRPETRTVMIIVVRWPAVPQRTSSVPRSYGRKMLRTVTDDIDSSTPAGRMMIGVLGSLAKYLGVSRATLYRYLGAVPLAPYPTTAASIAASSRPS
jgi:cobalamin biosynthesis protein CobT